MRKPSEIVLAALLALSAFALDARAAVILSELCDPQQNFTTDRFIEIYNTGPNPVDLTLWRLIAVANNVDVTTWHLSGTLAAGQAKVAGGPSTVSGFTVHFPSSSWTTGYANWNGGNAGDGAKLVDPDSVVVDRVLVSVPTWTDGTMVRKPTVTGPNPVYTALEWTVTPVTLATNATPGTHHGSEPPPPGPRVSNLAHDPASPGAGTPANVQASAVDPTGTISSVSLSWGTSSSSLPNSIAMGLLSDSTYRTNTAIPGQAAGITVYYRAQATGTSGTTQSSLGSYAIPANAGAPIVLSVGEMSDSTLLVFFSEPVQEASAEVPTNYVVDALTGVAAVRDPAQPSQVLITVRNIPAGARTLTVNGVADLDGNVASGISRGFTYIDVTIPAGYYSGITGLSGSALRVALHNRIKNHTVKSYAFALTAFPITDVKPNGKVWDVYSDVPGGTPPYEYDFDDNDQGAGEGAGYNREHSWPQSWFNEQSPMVSDLHMLYPTDSYVNGYRGNYPFGEVATPNVTSLNGSKRGTSATAGYAGIVFEPIDPYKGDLARSQFYFTTRYLGQDSGWDGSDAADGAELVPWAVEQYAQWSTADPVSWKERMRNGAIYTMQNNRNPFIDHPEFVTLIFDSSSVVGVDETPAQGVALRANVPNPFGARTTIGFDLARRERVTLRIYDVAGRRVRTLVEGRALDAGRHALDWDGRDDAGVRLDAGLYFCRFDAGPAHEVRRMVFAP